MLSDGRLNCSSDILKERQMVFTLFITAKKGVTIQLALDFY